MALTFFLLLGFTKVFVSPEFSLVGIVDRARAPISDHLGTSPFEKHRTDQHRSGEIPYHRAAPGVSFGSYQSLFRFDFKQNLRLWPVLAAGVERSPPSL